MQCPFCQAQDTKVLDSRLMDDGAKVRRRRHCTACDARFSTIEEVVISLPRIIKSNGNREQFDEHKLRSGLLKSLEKRPISAQDIDRLIQRIKQDLTTLGLAEVASRQLGEIIMTQLQALDGVAYVRFASVYRSFQDVEAFRDEIESLLKKSIKE